MNMMGGVGSPIQTFPNKFSLVLQCISKCCDDVKSLCHVSACIATVFPSMLILYTWVVVDSYLSWWFHLVWVAHNKLHPPDLTKCKLVACIFCFAGSVNVWLGLSHSFLQLGLLSCLYFSFPVIMDCTKPFLFFSAVEAAIHIWKDINQRLSALTGTVPNDIIFQSFLILANISKLLRN